MGMLARKLGRSRNVLSPRLLPEVISLPWMRSTLKPSLKVWVPLTKVRSSPPWYELYQYSRGAPLSTPKKFSGLVDSPWEPKEMVPKCSPGTKEPPFGNFETSPVITSSKCWKVRLKAKRTEFLTVGLKRLFALIVTYCR